MNYKPENSWMIGEGRVGLKVSKHPLDTCSKWVWMASLMLGICTGTFLAVCDFEYSIFCDIFRKIWNNK